MVSTVLLCDDEEVLRQLVRATLDNGDYSIVEAADGDESLELARRLQPDLIVLDMMMPGRSGLEVLRELRADPETAATPVIMLTARARESDRNEAASAGADRYLAKPFSPLELISVVEELVANGRGHRS
jgi:two-component system phosphate regulon response regulator PhoB